MRAKKKEFVEWSGCVNEKNNKGESEISQYD